MLHKQIKTPVRWIILAAISAVFLAFYSTATSPLSSYFGGDSSFFILVGKGMTEGMLPYRDFFDMKGPYLFIIEYIGQLLSGGRLGAFLIQFVNLFVCLVIIDGICLNGRKDIPLKTWLILGLISIIPVLYVTCYTFERGNLTEEFSLPALLLALYFAVTYLKQSKTQPDLTHPLLHGFYYGVAFGFLALIRITNAAFLGAILLTISVDLLIRKKYQNLLLNGLVFILGCVVACIPACVYFATQGLLEEMLSQVFIFGVQYSAGTSLTGKIVTVIIKYWRVLITMTFPIIVLALFRVKDWKYWCMAISSYLLLFFAAILGTAYAHYFTLGIPHIALGAWFLIEQLQAVDFSIKQMPKRKIAILLLLFLIMGRHFISTTAQSVNCILKHDDTHQQIQQIKAQIPEEDYDRVFVYGMKSCSKWYLQAGLFPPNKYCDWHHNYIQLNPQIGDELVNRMTGGDFGWIVVDAHTEIEPIPIAETIESYYTIYFENDDHTLYQYTGDRS